MVTIQQCRPMRGKPVIYLNDGARWATPVARTNYSAKKRKKQTQEEEKKKKKVPRRRRKERNGGGVAQSRIKSRRKFGLRFMSRYLRFSGMSPRRLLAPKSIRFSASDLLEMPISLSRIVFKSCRNRNLLAANQWLSTLLALLVNSTTRGGLICD